MFQCTAQGGQVYYDVKSFVVDVAGDIAKLPTNCHMGSAAFVIDSGERYILNGKREWVPVDCCGGSSSPRPN